jgi:hypothetical protein
MSFRKDENIAASALFGVAAILTTSSSFKPRFFLIS